MILNINPSVPPTHLERNSDGYWQTCLRELVDDSIQLDYHCGTSKSGVGNSALRSAWQLFLGYQVQPRIDANAKVEVNKQ
jgi:hypothetical protein